MKRSHHNNLAVADTASETERIRAIVNDLLSSGEVELDIDDADIRKSIATVQREARDGREGLVSRMDLFTKQTSASIDDLCNQTKRGVVELRDALPKVVATEIAKHAASTVTYDEAKLRQIADSVFQTLFVNGLAQSVKSGEKQPLPALQKVDPFFVENTQTAVVERALRQRRHLMASGPSGSGKTYPIEMTLRKHGRRYLKVSVADGLSFSDFVARANVRATAKGTETYYTYGFLPFSMKAGCALILDEIDQCQPEVVSIINAALETRSLYVPQTGEVVTAAAGWQVFMTCNTLRDSTGSYGGFRLNSALLNRLVFGKADYLTAAEESGILARAGLGKPDAAKIVGLMQGLRAAYQTGRLTQAPSTRLAVRVARCLLGHDDDGTTCDEPMQLGDAFAYCFLDGLPENEAREAAQIISNGL